MGGNSQEILSNATGLWAQIQAFSLSLLEPYRLYQVAILICLAFVAHAATWFLAPRIDTWIRSHTGLRMWQMRLLVLFRNRLRGVIFVLLAWSAALVVGELSVFVSRRYLLELVATLATTWVVIGFLVRVISNRFVRRIVSWGAWIYVTLQLLGFLDPAMQFLDSIAISFGSFRLSALAVIKALAVTAAMFALARLITETTRKRVTANPDISPSMQVLSIKLLQVALYASAFFIGLKAVGFDLSGFAVLSGAIGVGLGFGLQKVVSNLVSGVIILLDKSIKPGDVISLGDTFGWIESLGARYVSVVTRDGREYLIPNEDLITGQVVNWSHSNEFVRVDLEFGTSYGDDPHKVRAVAIAATKGVPRVLQTRAAVCHITGFGDSSVNYVLRFWITDPRDGLTNVRGNVFLALWDAFKAEGISIPFPQREVRMLNISGQDAAKQTTAGPA